MFYRRALSPSWLLRQQHSAAGLNLTLLSHCRLPNCVVDRANEIVTQGGVVGLAWGGSQSLGTLLLLIDTLCYSMPAPLPMTAGIHLHSSIPTGSLAHHRKSEDMELWQERRAHAAAPMAGSREGCGHLHPAPSPCTTLSTSGKPGGQPWHMAQARPPASHCLPGQVTRVTGGPKWCFAALSRLWWLQRHADVAPSLLLQHSHPALLSPSQGLTP